MAVRSRIDPIDRDIALMLAEELSPEAQSQSLARYAKGQFEEALETNTRALGRAPNYEQFVDGSLSAPLEQVKPEGVIVFEFSLVTDAIEWIQEQLLKHSPILSGRFRKSHILFADGAEVQFGADVPDADEYVFVNTQPYSRKIEQGSSKQAPDGVYEAVAVLASHKFGNLVKVRFTYREIVALGGARATLRKEKRKAQQPTILITRR